MRKLENLLVTGGAGFIGSHFVHHLFSQKSFSGRVVVYDLLTYAGKRLHLAPMEKEYGGSRLFFEKGDICDSANLDRVFKEYAIDTVVNFAAETHVDSAISNPGRFVKTNITGTFTLLEAARTFWHERNDVLFHQISTDEVFGSLGRKGTFSEQSPYNPRNPYAATKAAADHMAFSSYYTYGLPLTLSYSSNNYGPNQHEEKMIPSMIQRMLDGRTLPLYGDGLQVREWLFAGDHAEAIWMILQKGRVGERYAVGSGMEYRNLDLLQLLCCMTADEAGISKKQLLSRLEFVKDRKGHDQRYALNTEKIRKELGWSPGTPVDEGLRKTILWHIDRYRSS
jgi:dTDP-glucose 4,6-dehydratase